MLDQSIEATINLVDYGLLRVAVATPEMKVADVAFNLAEIVKVARQAQQQQCQIVLFPELCLTGYTCADLFFQQQLQHKVVESLSQLAQFSAREQITLVVGAPVSVSGRLFNCAAFISGGKICGLVPKSFLPNSGEFYEQRWFSSASERSVDSILINSEAVPFGPDLLFQADDFPAAMIGIEICEDAWSVVPPSSSQALAGATLLLNLSASPEILGKHAYRRTLVASQSARCLAAYAYSSAGPNESSTDLVFSGHSLIAENGQILTETERFQFDSQIAWADIDLDRLLGERQRNNTFAAGDPELSFRVQPFQIHPLAVIGLCRPIVRTPFVPPNDVERAARCQEIFLLQTSGLMKRLRHTGSQKVVIGLSGGLDSTLALLVSVKAFDRLGLDRKGIIALTMPGFGTTERTRGNAEELAQQLAVTLKVVSIDQAVLQHFRDIEHDPNVHDITYENSQARERTQILMDVANQAGGLVIGTGDLSELALGWCTYNGDHMSMYAVNCGVPKTLVRYLVDWCSKEEFSGRISTILEDVCATPVSPELLPPDVDGNIDQLTEQVVGPYELHDFFLFQVVRMHFPPKKVLMLAAQAFADQYSRPELRKWLSQFYRRFFSQQFKRSCLPDGPKVGTVALSPRGDWRMPSDAAVTLWLEQLEGLE
ncbi:NH(3)-dependent NAD(+) synthetase [Desulfuromusa kysingii]|uniref:Glutamine-dependent NAD(+) synthetase n=1 Tax=Desulfuromusa kysingii TaxID=37625 RepID=A0A1H3ZJ97_9BACT|nr:NAD(+) synthase [Desulfuromusa kysingii]SEA23678.1 NH(3)-dependent NAD(+) synthetase [Desulfuromusa kysingii]